MFSLTSDALLTLHAASEKCQQEKRKTVNGEDILFAMTSLGFENYAEALKIYLTKYREVSPFLRAFLLLCIHCSPQHSLREPTKIKTRTGQAVAMAKALRQEPPAHACRASSTTMSKKLGMDIRGIRATMAIARNIIEPGGGVSLLFDGLFLVHILFWRKNCEMDGYVYQRCSQKSTFGAWACRARRDDLLSTFQLPRFHVLRPFAVPTRLLSVYISKPQLPIRHITSQVTPDRGLCWYRHCRYIPGYS